jgi:hypothetical protein
MALRKAVNLSSSPSFLSESTGVLPEKSQHNRARVIEGAAVAPGKVNPQLGSLLHAIFPPSCLSFSTLISISSISAGEIVMAVEKVNSSSSLAEVIDRILDKGIVVDAWVRVSLVGIELLAIEARVVVASVETYLKYAEAVGLTATAAAPAV